MSNFVIASLSADTYAFFSSTGRTVSRSSLTIFAHTGTGSAIETKYDRDREQSINAGCRNLAWQLGNNLKKFDQRILFA